MAGRGRNFKITKYGPVKMSAYKLKLTPGAKPRKANKFNRKRVFIDGIWFDSKAEGAHYNKLKLLLRAGKIKDLKCHPTYPIVINGKPVGRYTPDFSFMEDGVRRIQDVKNPITKALSAFRIKVFEAVYKTEVEIVSNRPGKKFVSYVGYIPENTTDDEIKILREQSRARQAAGLLRFKRQKIQAHREAAGNEHGGSVGEGDAAAGGGDTAALRQARKRPVSKKGPMEQDPMEIERGPEAAADVAGTETGGNT